ncbi:hypothetical protein [Nitrosopumilus sp.]|uniref:hypothetical protein n=1 Tax=Nitrosopumilus sp. TaxID=2024843 RepID=UPI0026331C7E|nr:hypothetical protein [Nitrosopumilus sp.]
MYLKIITVMLLFVGFTMPAFAQSTNEFDYKIHPEKILENTVGTIQVFVSSNQIMIPQQISELKAVSSDTDVIKILEIKENNSKFSNEIMIKAEKSGIATIALAAPGIPSKEIAIEVFNNNNLPTQLMIKATPEEFPIDGPKTGYIAVQFATTGGLPTAVQEDKVIKIETPNTDVIKILNPEITVENGNYYGYTKFEIIGYGDAIIFAESDNMRKVSQIVKVLEPEETLEVKLTIIPDKFNSYTGTKGFAIVQLVDSGGIPVQAEEDIVLKLEVDNPDVGVNTSSDLEEVTFASDRVTIKKGEYSAYTTFTPRPNLADVSNLSEQTFQMFVSVENYLASGTSFTVAHDEIAALEGAGPAITQTLPFLTTGKNEIIGVTYFETEIEVSRKIENTDERQTMLVTVPVTAKDNYELGISSSDTNVLNPDNVVMEKGNNAVLLTGKTGTITTSSDLEIYITDNDGVKTVSPQPNGPSEDSIDLKIEPLLPMIMVDSEFPLLSYLEESSSDENEEVVTTESEEDEGVNFRQGPTLFVEDGILTFSANDIIDIEPINVKKNQEYSLTFETIEEIGSTTIEAQLGKITGNAELTSHTTDPTTIYLGFVDNMVTNDKHLATIQLLDSVGNPVYTNKDVIINLVSNNENVLDLPEIITIKEGEYFKTVEIETFSEGKAEIAILSQDLPLSKYEINTVEINPTVNFDFLGNVNWNERVEGKLTMTIPEIDTTLNGFDVSWEVSGGEILSEDKVTNELGIATINIVPNQGETLSVTGKISTGPFGDALASKQVAIQNIPVVETSESEATPLETNSQNTLNLGFELDTFTLLLIIIPVVIGGSLFFLKKTDRMELITERLPIGEKIEEIKERISDIRDR